MKRGQDILAFLRTFEGAASSFSEGEQVWSLWIPEIGAHEHPVTPASQVFFPVILRCGQSLAAIRFFYDCRAGKVRFYTGAIPPEVVKLPEFEHAVSELFRHSMPVEPIRQRSLRKVPAMLSPAAVPKTTPPSETPGVPAVTAPAPSPVEAASGPLAMSVSPPVGTDAAVDPTPTAPPPRARITICENTKSVLQVLILVLGMLGVSLVAAWVYLQVNEDPGIKHHRLQIEQQRLRGGR